MYKYADATARSHERAGREEREERAAVRAHARAFDRLSEAEVTAIASSGEVRAMVSRWQYACSLRGVSLVVPDAWEAEAEDATST